MAIKKSSHSKKAASRKAPRRKARHNPTWRKTGAGGWRKGTLGVTYLPGRGYVGHTSKEDGPILATRAAAQTWAEAHAPKANPMGGTYMVTHANPGKKKAKAKRNPHYANAEHAAEDLYLTTTNDGDLYRQQAQPIIENLAKKMAKGSYNKALAIKAWGYLVDNGARKCAWQNGHRKSGTTAWYQQGVDGNGIFPKKLRDSVAAQVEEHYRENVEERAAELAAKVKTKAKKNPGKKAKARTATKKRTAPRVPKRKNVPSSGLDRYSTPSGGGEWIQRMNPSAFQAGDYKPRTKIGTFYKKGNDILRVDDVGYRRRGGALRPSDWEVVFLGTMTDVPKTGPSPYTQAAHHNMAPYEIERNGYRKVKAESLNENWRAFFARHKP